MSPAPQRANIVAEEAMVSWATPNPTMTADLEGWMNYETSENRWYYWNGTSWLKLATISIATADIAASAVTFAKMQNIAGKRLLGNGSTGSDAVREIALAGLLDIDGTDVMRLQAGTAQSVLTTAVDGSLEWRVVGGHPSYLVWRTSSANLNSPAISGTSFPTTVFDGQLYYHTTHQVAYRYSTAAGGWMSSETFEFQFGSVVDWSTAGYLTYGPTGTTLFTDKHGWLTPFQCKVIGMSVAMEASGTCAFDVTKGGTAVGGTGGSLSLSSQITKSVWGTYSNSIAAGNVLGVKLASGTIQGPASGSVWLKRFET